MYKSMVKKFLAGLLSICMIAGAVDLSAFTVQAAGGLIFEDDGDVNWHFEYTNSVEYDGTQHTPTVTVYPIIDNDGNYGTPLNGGGVDYDVTYGANKNAGNNAGTIRLVGAGNYAGSDVTLYFNIRKRNLGPDNTAITVDAIPPQNYTGSALVPNIVVRDNGTALHGVPAENATTGTVYDYTYTCSNNIETGTGAVVTITGGNGNYTGTRTTTFEITRLDSDLLTASSIRNQSYDGTEKQIKPSTVEYDGTLLTDGTDYDVTWRNNRSAGEAVAVITGRNAYTGIFTEVTFKIIKNIRHGEMSVQEIGNQIYTGAAITLDPESIVITDADRPGYTLQPGTDFEIAGYNANTNLGQAEVTIKGIGAYSSTRTENFDITSATMNDVTISVAPCTYDGTPQEPAITVTRGNITYGSSDYGKSYRNNTAAGENTGIVTVSGNGSLTHSRDQNFTINRRSLQDPNVTMTLDYPVRQEYTGQPIKPRVTVKYRQGDGREVTLRETFDYQLNYNNCMNASTAANQATATITGIGNFTGDKTTPYTINQASLTNAVIDDITPRTYTGLPQEPGIRVTAANGNVLSKYDDITRRGDYTIEYTDNTNAGTARITIEGCGNYTGRAYKDFIINKKDISTSGVSVGSISAQTYNGRVQTPPVTLRYNGMTLNEQRVDYTVDYGDETTNRDVGNNTGKAVIHGTGNYTGDVPVNFSITGRNIGTGSFLSLRNLEQVYAFTGAAIQAENLEVYYNNPDAGMNSMLSANDYDVEYLANTGIGTATLKIKGNGNYSGYKDFQFKIKGDLEDADKTEVIISPQTYTGSVIEPPNSDITVKFNGTTLRRGTDYTVTFTGTEPGFGEAVIEGITNYKGIVRKDFVINKKNLNDVTGSSQDFVVDGIAAAGYEYNGYAIEPPLSINYNGIVPAPEEGTDYELRYEDTGKAGEASVTITGIGTHFEGSTKRTYQIHRYDIGQTASNVTLSGVVEDVVMENVASTAGVALQDGAVIQTGLTVSYRCTNPATGIPENRVLTEGENADYTVSYEANTVLGTAAVIITGQKNFTGTIRKEFKICGDLNTNGGLDVQRTWTYVPEIDGVYGNTPAPAVRYNGALLSAGTDYTVSYTDNDKVGTAIVTITANPDGKYVGSLNTTFEITKRILVQSDENLVISGLVESGYEYTGTAIVPSLTITYMGVELTAGDIEIIPSHNINVPQEGEEQPQVKITAKLDGNYEGSIDIPFIINPRPVSDSTIRVEGIAAGYDYNGGNEIKIPDGDLQLFYGSETTPLAEGDYEVSYTGNHEIGTATVTLTGKGNYEGSFEKNFYVMGNLNADYITIAEIEPVPYGIVAVTPTLTITDHSTGEEKPVTLNDGYEIVSCINNVDVATRDSVNPPTVTIRGKGCYKGDFTGTFDIVAKNLSEDEGDITAEFIGSINNADVSNAFVYTGGVIEPAVRVYNHGAEMAPGIDYNVAGFVHNTNVPQADAAEDMRPGVIIDAVENGNYLGRKIVRFNIIPKDIIDVSITFTGDSVFTYDRRAKEPGVAVTYTTPDGETHDFPQANYEISYQHNVETGTPADGDDAPAVVITGKGNFTGVQTKKFTIKPEELGTGNTDITAAAASAVYTGSPVGTTVILTAADGTVLDPVTDFEVGACTSNINAGTAYIAVRGIGNYTGNWNIPFTIEQKPIASQDITVSHTEPKIYTAADIKPEPIVTVGTGASAVTLERGRDYDLGWRENKNAGTAYVVIKGKNNYGGTDREEPFTIRKKNIGTNGTMDGQMTLQPIANQYYTGGLVKPGVSLAYNGSITQPLAAGYDYQVSYSGNAVVGTANATITGTGNYEGTINANFRILGNMSMASVAQIPLQKHTGAEIKPSPTVTFGGRTSPLVKDTDYELIYHSNVEKGIATIEVKGKGDWFTGSKTVTFTIAGEFSNQMQIAGLAASYTYTGKAITPSVRVTDYGSVLTEGRDYKLSYKGNVSVGTAELTVEGIGTYTGKKSTPYKIVQRNIGQCSVTNIVSQNYTGKKISPAVKLTYGGKTLKAGTDYTIVYTNNVKAGRANAIIKGKGDFIGTKKIGYNIVIPKVSGVKLSSYNSSSAKLSWKSNNAVTGYEIYSSSNKLVARLSRTKTSYTITKLRSGKTYAYKIRAYATKDGATKRSAFVTLRFSTAPARTTITSIRSSKSKQVVLKWKKTSGATEYIVYRSTSKKGKYTSIGTTKSTAYTDKKVTGGKTYYYKVRVRRTVDKKNYYSSYSAIKSIKAKK